MHNQRVIVQKVKIRKNKELVRTHKNRAKKKKIKKKVYPTYNMSKLCL